MNVNYVAEQKKSSPFRCRICSHSKGEIPFILIFVLFIILSSFIIYADYKILSAYAVFHISLCVSNFLRISTSQTPFRILIFLV